MSKKNLIETLLDYIQESSIMKAVDVPRSKMTSDSTEQNKPEKTNSAENKKKGDAFEEKKSK